MRASTASNNALNLTKSSQTASGLRRLVQCYLGTGDFRPIAATARLALGALVLLGILLAGASADSEEKQASLFIRNENNFTHDLLTIRDDGTYEMSTATEGPRPSYAGVFTRQGDVLTLAGAAGRVPSQLRVVDWGTRRYLVEPSRVDSLCAFIRQAARQKPPWFPLMVFYRSMDEKAVFPKSLPIACQ